MFYTDEDLKWDNPLGGLPFNSFIGNVALKSLLRRLLGVPL